MKGVIVLAIEEREFYDLKLAVQSNGRDISDLMKRVGDIERKYEGLYEISKNLSLIAQSLKHLENDLSELKEAQKTLTESHKSLTKKVTDLENAPAQETLANVKKIKIAAVSAVAGMLATGIVSAIILLLAK